MTRPIVTLNGHRPATEASIGEPDDATPAGVQVPCIAMDLNRAAKALSLSARTVDELARSGHLPSFRVGRRRLFSPDALRQWVSAQANENEVADA
ncbi:MAG: helix-turn-helix domain-containing protein [Phycisphaeraceae bacterium]|nr:helix-turn-helix domain-containing protein [Phycisphaeraceae bacterium]